MNNISNKVFFKKYGIFVGILAFIFGISIYSIKSTSKYWNRYLQFSVEDVLETSAPDTWTVGNAISINNPLAMNSALFEIRNRKTGTVYSAIIIRIQTLYGPLPAVYIMDSEKNVEFVGYSTTTGRIAKQLNENRLNKSIIYWKKKIPQIIK